jgi:hypothetical protein
LHKSTASLVHRRGPVYWFRKSVPADLIDRLGHSDIRRSLRTGLSSKALYCRRCDHCYQMPFDAIKHLKTDDPIKAIALNKARAVPLPPISWTADNSKF